MQFLDHLADFMDRAQLWPSSDISYIAVSGGLDSNFLAMALSLLWKKKALKSELRIIHINHGTRLECERDQKLVHNLADQLKIPCHVEKLSLSLDQSNFEQRARQERYKIFKKYAEDKHTIYLAHHIDDSYEWSMIQKNRSSNLKSSLGIPVKNGVFKRPFHCLTKQQIFFLAKIMEVEFHHDGSNDDLRYERNYLRKKVISNIEKRYPKRLQHYVAQSNDLARLLKVSAFSSLSTEPIVFQDICGGVNLLQFERGGHFHGQQHFIENVIRRFFPGIRGSLRNGVEQIIKAQSKGKNGPHRLASGIEVFYYQGIIQITDKNIRVQYRDWDKNIDLEQSTIKKSLDHYQHGPGPFWTVEKRESRREIITGLKKEHPLFPNLFKQIREKNLFLRPYSQLLIQATKKGFKNWQQDYNSLI